KSSTFLTRGTNAPSKAAISNRIGRAPRSTVTSTSAVRRAAPWTIAACAPKRNHRTPSLRSGSASARRTSAKGERTAGAIQSPLELDVVGQILFARSLRGPAGVQRPNEFPQAATDTDGRRRTTLAE